jgi:acyl carrier protein
VVHDHVAAELMRLLERAGVDPGDVTWSTPLSALYLDSLDHAEIREALHDEFGVEIDMADLVSAETVGQAVDIIASKARAS